MGVRLMPKVTPNFAHPANCLAAACGQKSAHAGVPQRHGKAVYCLNSWIFAEYCIHNYVYNI
jgi:hypothetical protein